MSDELIALYRKHYRYKTDGRYFCALQKNNTCIILCREDLHGIHQKWEFGDGFSVVFTILGASYFNFTLAMSLHDDRLVTNP